MKYQIKKIIDFTHIKNSPNTSLDLIGLNSENFSMTYINFENGRDPGEVEKIIKINKGFSATYIVTEGTFSFIVYDQESPITVNLVKNEIIKLESESTYEINGTGKLLLIHNPPYTSEMYSFPLK